MVLWSDGEETGERIGAMAGAAGEDGELGRGGAGVGDDWAGRAGAGAAGPREFPWSRRRTASAASETCDIA